MSIYWEQKLCWLLLTTYLQTLLRLIWIRDWKTLGIMETKFCYRSIIRNILLITFFMGRCIQWWLPRSGKLSFAKKIKKNICKIREIQLNTLQQTFFYDGCGAISMMDAERVYHSYQINNRREYSAPSPSYNPRNNLLISKDPWYPLTILRTILFLLT